jgi:hypothetical protein
VESDGLDIACYYHRAEVALVDPAVVTGVGDHGRVLL